MSTTRLDDPTLDPNQKRAALEEIARRLLGPSVKVDGVSDTDVKRLVLDRIYAKDATKWRADRSWYSDHFIEGAFSATNMDAVATLSWSSPSAGAAGANDLPGRTEEQARQQMQASIEELRRKMLWDMENLWRTAGGLGRERRDGASPPPERLDASAPIDFDKITATRDKQLEDAWKTPLGTSVKW